ncbi:unnamed protein product [marine sediment metagenome]|uniref:Uncharacterized protein n=1 Tax=marine sediment metagenome TaxID=412755 RepID=X0TMG7_9ZZZZ
MKLYSIYRADIINEDEELRDKIHNLIQKHYSHLRHYLRREIIVDEFLINEILTTVKDHYKKEK